MIKIDARNELHLNATANKITPALVGAIKTGVQIIKVDAQARAPSGAKRMLRRKISASVKSSVMQGYVVGLVSPQSSVYYAKFQEQGAKSHYVPLSAAKMRQWIAYKGQYHLVPIGNDRYDIYYKGTNTLVWRGAKYWHVSGKAQPFMTPAFEHNKTKVLLDIQKAISGTL